MISAPIILYPKTNWTATGADTYYSDMLVQMISGDIPVVPADIERNTMLIIQYRYRIQTPTGPGTFTSFSDRGTTVGKTTSTVTAIPWSFNSEGIITLSVGDIVHFEFKTVKVSSYYSEVGYVIDESSVSHLVVNIISESTVQATADAPTGTKLKRFTDHIKVFIPTSGLVFNSNSQFAGCNFYLSLTPGGGSGYVKMNTTLITTVDASETESVVITDSTYTDTTNDLEIRTIKSRNVENEYFTYVLNKDVIARLIIESKIPNIFLSDGQTLRNDIVYYFVTSVVAFDSLFNQAVESPYSLELEAQFLKYTTDYQNLPTRSRSDILFSISNDMMTNNDMIAVVPGSVIRDLSDPVALEFEKFYVIQDFVFATLSVDTLMIYDDPNGDGESDAVQNSPRKSALAVSLGITDPIALQFLIDEQFDKQASNYNMVRKGSTTAKGTAVFYTNIRPTVDLLIADGTVVSTSSSSTGSSVSFRVRGSKILEVKNVDYYYNSALKRYEIEADIEASLSGSVGNVPANSITVLTGMRSGMQVVNTVPTRYGTDKESNIMLANRTKLAKVSYDSGTQGGYTDTAYGVPGVVQARVEEAGDPLMMRDYDTDSSKHIGGKVDVYVRGESIVQLLDQVAFKYEYPTDTYGNKTGEQFYIVSASEFMLRARNPKVTSESPIINVTRVRNVTRAKDYILSGLQITGEGNTVLLSKNAQNLDIGMASLDVVKVNYLYRSTSSIALSNQPVKEIVQVTSSSGVVIDSIKYVLVKEEDPLQNGMSSIAKDSIKFLFNETDDIPDFVQVSNEEHMMLLDTPARLVLKGVDIATIVVIPPTVTTPEYIKDVDYSITVGSENTYTYLNLSPNSMIRHGDMVRVSYQASENFNITYTTNGLVQQVQSEVNKMKHACADTIVKEAVGNFADISFKVVRKTGVDSTLLKSRLQTSVANYVSNLKMGDGLTQGTLVSILKGVEGVKDIKLPLTRMMKRNSSFIPLDDIGYITFEIFQKTSSSGVTSYRSVNSVLTYKTSNGGGDPNLFRGVYENNILLTMTSIAGDVSKGAGRSYILSDGRIVVSTTDGKPPQSKHYKASYYTYYAADDNPVEDLTTSEIEYLDVDSISMKDIEVLDEKIVKRGL